MDEFDAKDDKYFMYRLMTLTLMFFTPGSTRTRMQEQKMKEDAESRKK